MKLIYNVRNRTIREYKRGSEEVDLALLESKLIEVLSDNVIHSWEDIADYIYGDHDKYAISNVHQIKNRLLKKVNINITNFHAYGIILEDEIYVEKIRSELDMKMTEESERLKHLINIKADDLHKAGYAQKMGAAAQGWQCPVCR